MISALRCCSVAMGTGLAALALAHPVAAQHTLSPAQLVGYWQSAAPENQGAFHLVRSFVFTERAWALTARATVDAKLTEPLFTLRIEGDYAVGKPAEIPRDATEAAFFYHRRYVRADSATGAAFFKSQGCDLPLHVEVDVSLAGCGFVPAVTSSGIEYDLLKISGEQLFLGERSGDLAKSRPRALSTFPLTKR